MKDLSSYFPTKTFFISIFIWILLAAGNCWANYNGYYSGVELLFPSSVIYPSNFSLSGTLFGIAFLIVGSLSCLYLNSINKYTLFLLCTLLVALGDMIQGNVDITFLQSFYFKGRQYYADATLIENWLTLLKKFHIPQENFQLHTRTHSPFIALLYYFFLTLFDGDILGLGLSFTAIGSLNISVFYDILSCLDFNENLKKKLALLFSVIPSFDIYSIVSISGIFPTFTLTFIIGICRIYQLKRLDFMGVILSISSITYCNLISFSRLFFFTFLDLPTLWAILRKSFHFMMLSITIGISFIGYFHNLYYWLNYNHLEVFFNASKMENKDGFMLLSKPLVYFGTILGNIEEILFFLSFGFIALLLSTQKTYTHLFFDIKISTLFFSAILALLTIFLARGIYNTEETAKTYLFTVLFFVLLLKGIHHKTFSAPYFLCPFQTFGMRLTGNYY